MSENGYNPMRWDCNKQGCFNKKRRPKIEVFADCLPGKIAFTDIDGITEVNGRALVLECKTDPTPIPRGQAIMWHRLTKTGLLTVLCLAGDAETMDVTHCKWCYKGVWDTTWAEAALDDVKALIRQWVADSKTW